MAETLARFGVSARIAGEVGVILRAVVMGEFEDAWSIVSVRFLLVGAKGHAFAVSAVGPFRFSGVSAIRVVEGKEV